MDRGASGAVGLETEFTLQDCSTDEVPKTYKIAVDEDGKPAWAEASGPENQELDKSFELFPAGMGEAIDRQGGGYPFSRNVYHGRPGALLPTPERKTLTLTGITAKPSRVFEAESTSGTKYVYWLAGTKVAKVRVSDMALRNVRDLTGAAVNFKTGSYTGTGASLQVTGLGFTPDCVVVVDSEINGACIRVAGMAGTKRWVGDYYSADGITSLDTDGFTVGSASYVNTVGRAYHWMAWKQASGYVNVGSYTGDGTTDASKHIHTVGFQPDLVWVWDQASGYNTLEVVSRHSTHAVDETVAYSDFATYSTCISALLSDGFSVRGDAHVNTSGHTYWYVAFKALSGFCALNKYDGDGTDNRNITGVGFDPQVVLVSRYGTAMTPFRTNTFPAENSAFFANSTWQANMIQSLITDGFQVGSAAETNADAATIYYHWVAFRSMSSVTPAFGQPAYWNSLWHLPCGPDVAFKQLTVITDDTSDDTWMPATGLYADHFCVVENYIFEVVNDREISKCSSPNTTVSGNWAHAYDVGQPGEKVTQMVAVGSEVGICTDRSYYRFDKVSVGRSQLDDAKPPADPDNGKGAFQFATWTLLPYTGYYRQQGEGVLPIGVDRLPLNTPMPFITYQPRFGKHGWTVGLGGWLYNIYGRKTATGTYIMCAQIEGRASLGLIWDPLFHTTSADEPTILFIDSSKRLWWDTGTNVTYIQLGADGSPEGGNFGNVSSDSYFYLPEISAGGAVIQARELEVEVRNGDPNFRFRVGCHRNGGSSEWVEAAWVSNLETIHRVHWDAGTNDTCYAVALYVYGAMDGSYTPSATPPEIRRIRFRGTVMAEQIHEIEVTILLNEGDERSVRQRFEDLRAMPVNGVHLLRHPIRGEIEYVTINQVVPTFVFQAGADQPEAAATVRMRRGDF